MLLSEGASAMPGKWIDKPQNLRPVGTPRSGAIQRTSGPAKSTPPPMAGVILAKFQSPKRPAAPSAAVPGNATAPGRAPTVAGPGYIQQKPGPPPMASGILSRFNSGFNRSAASGGPSVTGISAASGVADNAVARKVPNMGSGLRLRDVDCCRPNLGCLVRRRWRARFWRS